MTVWALYSVYDERRNLPRCMDSVERCFDGVVHVTVDGRYPDFDGEHELSTDGTRALAIERGFLIDCTDYECEKRTAGLSFIDEQATDGDYVLVLDADEELTEVSSNLPARVGYISFTRTAGLIVTYGRCRLYRWEPGLHFSGRHYDLYDADGNLFSSLEDAPQYDLVGSGLHHNDSHDPERKKRKQDYYKRLREREGHPSEKVGA